jgi:iron complex outermembrane receptor protein
MKAILNSATAIGLVLVSQSLCSVARAQDKPAAESAAPVSSSALDEVIVTAQRRSENLQKVPLAVTSLSQASLQRAQINSALDIARVVPNMIASNNVGQGSANVYYIRGLGQTQSFPTFEPQVGTYVDDIYIGRQNANNLALFGVEQVQVLRGPQGTLFGRNSTGGAVVVTLQKPSDAKGGDLDVGYGSFNQMNVRGAVNLPLSEQVSSRTAAFWTKNDGYVQNLTNRETLNGIESYGIREALRIRPANYANVEWNLAVDYSNSDSANVLNFPGPGGVDGSGRVAYTGYSKNAAPLSKLLTGAKSKLGQGVEVASWGGTSNLKIDMNGGTLSFITGIRGLDQKLGVDFPLAAFGPLVPFDQGAIGQFALAQALRSTQYSQEVKWNGELGANLSYTAGAFYMFETNRNNFGAAANLGPLFGALYIPFPLGDELTKNDTKSAAVYAQGDYKVSDKLTLTFGGRLTHEVKTLTATPNSAGSGFTTQAIKAAGYKTKLSVDEFTPRVAVQYQVNSDVMVFASATRGFQGGGWNGLTFAAKTFNNFDPETIWSYETGLRTQTADRKFRFNGTLFYSQVQGYQLLSDLPSAGDFVTTNAADFTANGAEFDLDWRPIDKLSLSAQIGLMQSEYKSPSPGVKSQQAACRAKPGAANAACGAGIVNLAGALAEPSQSPNTTLSGSATYDFDLNGFTLSPTLSLQWLDKQNVSTASLKAGAEPARTVLDFGVVLTPNNQPWNVSVECKNCTMEDWGTTYLFGYKYYNTPGTWAVRAHYRF